MNFFTTSSKLKLEKDLGHSTYYRALKFNYLGPYKVMYRYPYLCDSEEFVKRLCDFIENDIRNSCYELVTISTTFYIDVIRDQIQFVDRGSFKDNEKKRIEPLKPPVLIYC